MSGSALETGSLGEYRHADPGMDAALEWYLHLHSGEEIPDNLERAFRAWMALSPANRAAFQEVEAIWGNQTILEASRMWPVCSTRPEPVMRKRQWVPLRTRSWHWQAAAAFLLVTMGLQLFSFDLMVWWRADYQTNVGQTTDIRLPDGSRMVLNSKSAVRLDFDEQRRGVTVLAGEAWFDVIHDAAHPFRVEGRFSDTLVLGTQFAVKVEPDDDVISLETGRVEAVHHDPSLPRRHLLPGQMVKADRMTISDVSEFDRDEALGWLGGRYVFADKRLEDVLDDLADKVPERIIVLNRKLLNVPISGNFRLERPQAMMAGIAAAAGGRATSLPGGYIIIR